jgi:hypothetical protein
MSASIQQIRQKRLPRDGVDSDNRDPNRCSRLGTPSHRPALNQAIVLGGAMSETARYGSTNPQETDQSALSWAAIVAGGVAAAALTLVLLAFGSAMGFSAVSPWSNSGISAGTFKLTAGIYLIVAAMLSSTIGGYIAGRVRTKWVRLHTEEVLFRDTAHGFLSWALATVFGAAALGAAATYMVGGTTTPAQSTEQTLDYFVDALFRPGPNAQAATTASNNAPATREARVVLARGLTHGVELPAADRSYLAQLVAARTSLPAAEADKRVSDVISQAKAAADQARKAAAALSMWLTAAMLVGAFCASLAAIEGGQLRDGRWKGVIGAKHYRAAQF